MDIYFYEFECRSGIRNMAVDEAMLETARRLGVPVCRYYMWSEPTVSLGYFQRYEDRHSHPASLGCPVVRRLTGGRAIVHDREWTYSLAVPSGHPFAVEHRLRLYETVHRAVIGVLSDWGVDAFLAGEIDELATEKPDKGVFLCFRCIAPGDVVVRSEKFGWVKLLGSAQYRDKHGGVLQHGSLLRERSPTAPELPGLKEIRPMLENLDRFAGRLAEKLQETSDLQWRRLSDEARKEMESSIAIFREKRYAEEWIKRR